MTASRLIDWMQGKTVTEARRMTPEEKVHLREEFDITVSTDLVMVIIFGEHTHYIFSGSDGKMFFGNNKVMSLVEVKDE